MGAGCIARQPTPAVLTPIYRPSAEQLHHPNLVKMVLASDGRGLYISRSALPHVRDVDPPTGLPTPTSGVRLRCAPFLF